MAVTVRWLLGRPDLRLTPLAGEAGLDRPLTWAHAIELPDPTPWLSGGEVVLTTGLRLPRGAAERAAYLERLAAAGVAAVGFGVGLSHARVPAVLVETAERLGLPLFSIPLPTPFMAVTRTVADRIAEEQYDLVRSAARTQQRMTRAALSGGTAAIVSALATAVEGDVLVLDGRGEVLAAHPAPPDPGLAGRVAEELAGVRPGRDRFGVGLRDERGHLVIESLRIGRGPSGVIAVARPGALSGPEHLLVNHAASLITLDLGQSPRSREAERAVRATVLSLLVAGRIDGEELVRHLGPAGFAPRRRVAAAVVDGVADRAGLVERLESFLGDRGVPHLITEDRARVVLLFGPPQAGRQRTGPSADELLRVADGLAEEARAFGGAAAATGVGDAVRPAEAAVSLRQAFHAARLARAERRPLQTHAELRLHALLLSGHPPETLREMGALVLGPLIEHDRAQRGDLVRTLEAFLRCNGHWETAAAELGVHRHTVRHRVRRMEELTGRRLDSAQDRAELLLALSAHRLGGDGD